MSRVLERAPVTEALAAWLEDALGRPVGRSQSPAERPFPYLVLYTIPGGSFSGSLSAPDGDAELIYQVNAVALAPAQAEQLADSARAVMLDRHPSGLFVHPSPVLDGGWHINQRRPDGAPGDVVYSGTPPRRVFTSSERYAISVTWT